MKRLPPARGSHFTSRTAALAAVSVFAAVFLAFGWYHLLPRQATLPSGVGIYGLFPDDSTSQSPDAGDRSCSYEHRVSFHLFVEDPIARPVALGEAARWLAALVGAATDHLAASIKIVVDTDTVLFGTVLDGSSEISPLELRTLWSANGWDGRSYSPAETAETHFILLAGNYTGPSKAVFVPGWGGLVLLDGKTSDELTRAQVEAAFDVALAQLRRGSLRLDTKQPANADAKRKEAAAFAARCVAVRTKKFATTLRALSSQRALAGADTHVTDETAATVSDAAARMATAARTVVAPDMHFGSSSLEATAEATREMWRAHADLSRVAGDPGMASPGFFPTEHYLSVILPLALPAAITMAMAARRFALEARGRK